MDKSRTVMKPSIEEFKEQYGAVFENDLLEEIYRLGVWKDVPANSFLMDIGQIITHIPLILSGSIKIMTEDDDGSELLLYYLEFGDTCAMTLNCCTKKKKSNISALTEEDTTMFMIPVEQMELWMVEYASWRNFVLESYNMRLQEMLEAIDNLAFNNMEERVMNYLNKRVVGSDKKLGVTHAQIAQDLNSSRVVISRILKKLSIDGQIEMNRNELRLLN